jgi:hypothetical protein
MSFSDKPGSATIGVDTLLDIPVFHLFRHWIGKSTFKGHEFRPVDMDISNDAVVAHTTRIIKRSGTADQHFFGIATAQRTGTPERPKIGDGNFPSGSAYPHGRRHCCCSGTDDCQIILFSHVTFSRRQTLSRST